MKKSKTLSKKVLGSSFGKTVISLEGRDGLVLTRVSSVKQETQGDGHGSQELRNKQHLQSLGVPYIKTFRETISGGADLIDREGVQALLDYVDARPYKKFVLCIDDLKRFARDLKNHIEFRMALKARDVVLVSPNFTFQDTEEGEVMELVNAVFNQYERKANQRQVIQKQKARLENGYWAFTPLKGYRKVKHPIHIKLDMQTDDAEYIKEALEGYANMKFVYKVEGAEFLQKKGVIAKKQTKEKAVATYERMLKNVFYAGYIEYELWEVKRRKGHHKGMIGLDVFEKNQRRLVSEKMNYSRQTVREEFELRRLVNCVGCSKEYTGAPSKSKTGKKHDYYKCQTKGCIFYGKSIKKDTVHDEFKTLLKGIKPTQEIMDLTLAIFRDVWKEEIQNSNKNSERLTVRKGELEEQITKITQLMISSKSEKAISELEKQIEKFSDEIKEIDNSSFITTEKQYDEELYRTCWNELSGVLENPLPVWESYDVFQKQRFFKFIFDENLHYSKTEGYRTPKYALPLRIFEEISHNNILSVQEVEKLSNSLKTYIFEWSDWFKHNPYTVITVEKQHIAKGKESYAF